FLLTRLVYFTIALLTPSPAYDSSTNLILPPQPPPQDDVSGICWSLLSKLSERLTRWDAIYFVKIAERGYLREQEWAFGWGWTRIMGALGRGIRKLDIPNPYPYVFAGILLANLSHFLSVLVLYNLTRLVYPAQDGVGVSFVAATMHVLTPAGMFLVAPYSEGLFALLSFLGYYFYQAGWVVGAGAMWMLAGMVRSNGVLNGVVVLVDFVKEVWVLLGEQGRGGMGDSGDGVLIMSSRRRRLARIAGLGVAGVMVGLGLIVPQGIAWMQFCAGEDGKGAGGAMREWCSRTVPSIYLYVQDKYWNVGFLRYWTAGNIPLFLLAAPILYILTRSSLWAILNNTPLSFPPSTLSQPARKSKHPSAPTALTTTHDINTSLIRAFALPQLILAILAFTSYHVQIINRLSSGYVVWYWWLAQTILRKRKVVRWAVRWCVGYALVQGVLFAGFLPPA
ncbi:GPI mannosyltransferase 2, partial [Terfezia claveryi]